MRTHRYPYRREAAVKLGAGRDGDIAGDSKPLQGHRESVREVYLTAIARQNPASFHATRRRFIHSHMLASIVSDQPGQHIPMNRVSARLKCKCIDPLTKTLASRVTFTFGFKPIFDLIETRVIQAERFHVTTRGSPS